MISTGLVLCLALIPAAYALGMLPSARLVARRSGVDIAKEGSGNPGASNVIRLVGWRAGLLVLALDVGKGALAAGVGLALDDHRGHLFWEWRLWSATCSRSRHDFGAVKVWPLPQELCWWSSRS